MNQIRAKNREAELKAQESRLMKAIKTLHWKGGNASATALASTMFIIERAFLIACSKQHAPSNHGNNNHINPLTLYFNKETGAQFVARTQSNSENPLPTSTTTFYSLDWDKHPIKCSALSSGQNSRIIPYIM
ncbi:hypothetical protein FQR65_LT20268 [Abscondita terminalis]|nr:hypothetical protein FQR65_LT20268 [Abscondita terminalis]